MWSAFPKDLSTWQQQDSNPGRPPGPEGKCLPLDHNAILIVKSFTEERGCMAQWLERLSFNLAV